ncbi:cytochrome c [Novosphingobium marinum]|nr:cytochrome c [Novosphingobium marinum]
MILIVRSATGAAHGVGSKAEQPIPFSHKQHIEEVGLTCERCHAGAETKASAGIPANAVCLECHEGLFRGTPDLRPLHEAQAGDRQVAWKAVSFLPDHARFHHGAHARAGVTCATCHGKVEEMEQVEKAKSLTMDFCVDCHRAAQSADGKFVEGRRIAIHSDWRRDLTDCSVCHY